MELLPKVQALVSATSVESGRFQAVERAIDRDDLLQLVDQLTGIGQGYLELRSAEHEFPVLTVGFRRGFAVIQCASTPDQTALLHGDGSIPPGETIDVPIVDELATFTGEFVLTVGRARKALEDFTESGNPACHGEWYGL